MGPSDGNPTTLRRDPSVEFWVDGESIANGSGRHRVTTSSRSNADLKGGDLPEDPPSALINKFLHRQRASGDFSVDTDLESPMKADLGENRVSLLRLVLAKEASVRRRRGDLLNGGSGDDDVSEGVQGFGGEEVERYPSKDRHSRLLQPVKHRSRLLNPREGRRGSCSQ